MGIQALKMLLLILIFAIIVLVFVYWQMSRKNKEENNVNNVDIKKENNKNNSTSKEGYTKLSVFDFMEFDKVEDNMIIQDDCKKYLMVIECEGINYDLMSEVEKVSVEQGFIQFLNVLNHPIQIYVQTRTINISKSIENYNKQIDGIRTELNKKRNLYNRMLQDGGYDKKDLENVKREVARQQNLYEYGTDIVTNIEGMSLNKNVLKKHYYIIVPYYSSELGSEFVDEEEKRSLIFSELYTRAQSIVRTLFACSMKCRVMNSEEIIQLLYVAYNRDESEIYGVDKALESGYGEFYSTAEDVLDKKMKALNNEIDRKALQLAEEKVDEIKSNKQVKVENKEKHFQELVSELAQTIIKENAEYIGKEDAKKAIEEINNDNKKEVKTNDMEKTKTRRARKNA